MDTKTFVGWMQLAIGAYFLQRGYASWRAGRARDSAFMAGATSVGLGIASLTSGWVYYGAMALTGIFGVAILQQMFRSRGRLDFWINLIFCALCLPIVVTELLVDDLNWWQTALFASLGVVVGTLAVRTTVRLVRSYARVNVPSA